MAKTTDVGAPLEHAHGYGRGASARSAWSPGRRAFLRCGIGLTTLMWLGGCDRQESVLSVGTNTFPGYEFMHVAGQLGYFDRQAIRVIRFPATTQVVYGVSSGELEVVALTLDELLVARAAGLPLRAIAVLDVSVGADMVFARPGLETREDFLDKVIYVEKTGVGAVMLDAFLKHLELSPTDVRLRYALGEEIVNAFVAGLGDAAVVFSPANVALEAAGAHLVFDSGAIPGRIIDILAVTETALNTHTLALTELLRGHFAALKAYQAKDPKVRELLARGLGLPPERLDETYATLELPGVKENQAWFLGLEPQLLATAKPLARIMVDSGLLPESGVTPEVLDLADGRLHFEYPNAE